MTSEARKQARTTEAKLNNQLCQSMVQHIPEHMPHRAKLILLTRAFMGATEAAQHLGINRSRVNAISKKYGYLLPTLVGIRDTILSAKAVATTNAIIDNVSEYVISGKGKPGSVNEASQLVSMATQLSKISREHAPQSAPDKQSELDVQRRADKALETLDI